MTGHGADDPKGRAEGRQAAGRIVNRELEVETLPGDIPEHITVDVSERTPASWDSA